MKDFKKTDAVGNPMSRGFGFITFTEHEHALKALNELNNNPNIFTASKVHFIHFYHLQFINLSYSVIHLTVLVLLKQF